MKIFSTVSAFLFLLGTAAPALATPVSATVGCAANSCTITPNGGPVLLDPLDFSLEVDWSPQHIKLIEPDDDRLELRVSLLFDVTGSVSDVVDNVAADALAFTDMNGIVIGGLNENFDDVPTFNPVLTITFDVFGPDAGSTFLAHGFNLAPSSLEAVAGTFDSFAFREARLLALQGTAMSGVWAVPEPDALILLGVGLLATVLVRRRTPGSAAT